VDSKHSGIFHGNMVKRSESRRGRQCDGVSKPGLMLLQNCDLLPAALKTRLRFLAVQGETGVYF